MAKTYEDETINKWANQPEDELAQGRIDRPKRRHNCFREDLSLCLMGCIFLILAISRCPIARFKVKNTQKSNQDSDFSRKCVVFGVESEYGVDPII